MEVLTTPADAETPTTSTPERTAPLKLSEAIRLGAMVTEQTFGEYGDETRTCAIGAAQVAFGITPGEFDRLNNLLQNGPRVRPLCGHDPLSLGKAIIHLNDYEHWPRERIADWLAKIGM